MKKLINDYKQLIMVCLICISLVSSVLIYSNFALKRDEEKRKYEQEQIRLEQEAKKQDEANKQARISMCITLAESKRKSLWKSNCDDPDGKCTISSQTTINWIEDRYNEAVDTCINQYK